MVHVVWSTCFLSMLIVSFLTNSTATHTRALLHHDGHASRDDLNHVFHGEKVTKTQSCATTSSETNAGDKTTKVINTASIAKAGSRIETFGGRVRRLLPKQLDMDEFVAYADYKGPMHHPPRNN